MHCLQLFVVKTRDQNEAESMVEEFMQPYYGHEWDWYKVGGRYDGKLDGSNFASLKDCYDILEEFIADKIEDHKEEYDRLLTKMNTHHDIFNGVFGYQLACLGKNLAGYYHFEPMVYDIEFGGANELPAIEDAHEYSVLVADVHN